MQSFAFRLDRILNWRRKEFDVEEALLGRILSELRRLEAARQAMIAARDGAGRDLVGGGPVDGLELAALGNFRARLEKDLEINAREREQVADRLAKQRARVVEAQRRVRLLEKLRGRKLEEWRAAWNRELEAFAGEAFLARWRPN